MSTSNIPPQAYLYRPKESDIKAEGQRQLFDGNLQLDQKEAKAVSAFRLHATRNHCNLVPSWNDNKILRFLQACNFKNDKTLTSINGYVAWRQNKLPIKVDSKLQNFLNSGFFYIHGRDHNFRPIVVFNINQLDPKNFDIELITNALTFWFEYLIDEWMLPGQIEQWIFVTNLKGMSIATMTVHSVRKLFAYLQDNYKCRLYKMYLINAPTSIYIPWSICKKFLDGDTIEKVNFGKTSIPNGLFSHTNRSQIEAKFGGSAPNATQFWPPVIPSDNYSVSASDAQNLMSKEEYNKLYKSEGLKDMNVNMTFIEEESNKGSTQVSFTTPHQTTASPAVSEGVKSFESLPELDADEEYTDFLEEMSECYASDQKICRAREFEASFLSKLEAHTLSNKSVEQL